MVCPQADRWVIRGTLSGPRQHNNKAEVHAIKNALDISFDYRGRSSFGVTAPTLHRDYSDFFKMEKIFQMTQVRI